MTGQVPSSYAPRVFPNTRWSVVLAATQRHSPESAAALEAIWPSKAVSWRSETGTNPSSRFNPVHLPMDEDGVAFRNVSLRSGFRTQPSAVVIDSQQKAGK